MHARKICSTLRNREENVQRKTTSPGFESRIFRILHALYPDVCADHRPVSRLSKQPPLLRRVHVGPKDELRLCVRLLQRS